MGIRMVEPFKASFVKLARAKKLVNELEQIVADYIGTNPVEFNVGPSPPDSGIAGVRIEFSGQKPVPDELGSVFGDVIHNLRAALDLMACDLCKLKGASTKDVYFPFCESVSQLPKMIIKRHFDQAGPEAVRLLHELQPYKGGNTALRAIHDLDIQDKHQMLIVTPMSFASPILELHDGSGNYYRDEHGRLAPRVVGDPTKPSEIRLQFPPDGALAGKDLIPTLHELVETTAGVIEAFKALTAPAG